MNSEMQPADADGEECLLDPYGYQPGIGSRIAGLASGQTGQDPNYVFHTDYVAAGRGYAHVRVRFSGLTAREGVLMVRIHQLRQDSRPQLVLVTSDRIAFNRLAQNNGELELRFEVFNNCVYAIYGSVLGDTDATADGLEVVLRKPVEVEDTGFHTEARNSVHGQAAARPKAMLLSATVPTLTAPASQLATPAQLRSREALAILTEARLPGAADAAERWSVAYTVRALETYGVLGDDARGLGLAPSDDPVARLLDGRGVAVDCLYDRDGALAMTPRELVNFDFLWRRDAHVASPSGENWTNDIEKALRSLFPGGLGVFTFGYDPLPPTQRSGGGARGVRDATRHDLERLALMLVSRGHQVAELRIVGDHEPLPVGDVPGRTVAGLIVRRARVPD